MLLPESSSTNDTESSEDGRKAQEIGEGGSPEATGSAVQKCLLAKPSTPSRAQGKPWRKVRPTVPAIGLLIYA